MKPNGLVPPSAGQKERYKCLNCGHNFSKSVGIVPILNKLLPVRCPKCKSSKCVSIARW